MNNKITNENIENIKNGFLTKIHCDTKYIAVTSQTRTIRKSLVIAIAVIAVIVSTAIITIAVGIDPMETWRSLFEQEEAVVINEQLESSGIRIDVRGLYTDGNQALLEMSLKDLTGDRLSEGLQIYTNDYNVYWSSVIDYFYDVETGVVTCIVFTKFNEDVSIGETFIFSFNEIYYDIESTGFEYSISGDWSVNIDLAAIGESLTGSVKVPDHPDVTEVSFRLSSMYFEIEIVTDIIYPDYESWVDGFPPPIS